MEKPYGQFFFNPPAFAPPGVPTPLGRPIGVLHRGAQFVFLHRSCWPWIRGGSWPTWGPKNTYFRETLPDSAGSSSCAPRTPLAGFYRPGRVVWCVLGRFRGGVSIYVLGGFRLVLNSNRIEIVKLGGSDRAARARGATNSHPISPSAAGCRQPKAPRRPQPAAGDLVGWQRAPCLARAGLRAPQPAWCPTD